MEDREGVGEFGPDFVVVKDDDIDARILEFLDFFDGGNAIVDGQ